MSGFTKLFASITESTVWCEPLATRVVWITMLAKADQHGRVFASIPGLAHLARVTIEEAEAALERFKAPDRYSRTVEFEGRRIEDIDGGWRLLNHAKYRAARQEEERREYQRTWVANKRAMVSTVDTNRQCRPPSPQAEAEAEAEVQSQGTLGRATRPRAPRPRFERPTIEAVQAYITEKGYRVDATAWMAHYESNGWKVGRNPMVSWKAAVTTWSKRDHGQGAAGGPKKYTDEWIDAEYKAGRLKVNPGETYYHVRARLMGK